MQSWSPTMNHYHNKVFLYIEQIYQETSCLKLLINPISFQGNKCINNHYTISFNQHLNNYFDPVLLCDKKTRLESYE